MATMPSPPGRFSTTTDWPQRADSLSANSRAPISTPLPGPSVTINRTGRFGHDCAAASAGMSAGRTSAAATSADSSHFVLTDILIGVPYPLERPFSGSFGNGPRQHSLSMIAFAADRRPRKCLVRSRVFCFRLLFGDADAPVFALAAAEMVARRAGRRYGCALGGEGSAPDQRGARPGQAREGAHFRYGKPANPAARSDDRRIPPLILAISLMAWSLQRRDTRGLPATMAPKNSPENARPKS